MFIIRSAAVQGWQLALVQEPEGFGQERGLVRNSRRVFVVAVLVVGGMVGTQAAALADAPDVVGPGPDAFLCPIVGDGVRQAVDAGHAGGVSILDPLPGGESIIPGHNQAGATSNPAGHNADRPGDSPGPGAGNSGWSAIWPAA